MAKVQLIRDEVNKLVSQTSCSFFDSARARHRRLQQRFIALHEAFIIQISPNILHKAFSERTLAEPFS